MATEGRGARSREDSIFGARLLVLAACVPLLAPHLARMVLAGITPKSTLAATLNSTYRIRIADGRTFVGSFVCIDPQGNIVLDRALEYVVGVVGGSGDEVDTEELGEGRDVGMVLVKKQYWVKVEREA
jgi:small nuclear ribonucleoprotein (snRNP)-like protein